MYAKFQRKLSPVILIHVSRLGKEDMPNPAAYIKPDGPCWPVPRKKKGKKGDAK